MENIKNHFGLLIVIVVIAGAMFFAPGRFPSVDGGRWQAVFLNNNQVYFGRLSESTKDYVALKEIFYLRAVQPLQQGADVPSPALSLVKLGSELHGPEDVMYIPKSNILFWENLKTDSQVVQAITNFLGR